MNPAAERERAPAGPGSLLAGLASLVHPGPSLLVSACFVAAAAAARHRLPDPLTLARLVGVMLPLQFASGALNDLMDRPIDRVAKPAKPLVSGAVTPGTARGVAAAGFALGLGLAATFPFPTLPLAGGCAAAGAAYDLGLKRGAISWLPYFAGFTCLPLCAWAAESHLVGRSAIAVLPVALLLAVALHLANSAPDADRDRSAGSTGLAVRLGASRSRDLSLMLAVAAGVLATALAPLVGQPWPVALAGCLAPTVAAATLLALRRELRPFPLLAPAAAILSAVWLFSLP
jgi:4-hydroxybenzoate polyprenyltransferase